MGVWVFADMCFKQKGYESQKKLNLNPSTHNLLPQDIKGCTLACKTQDTLRSYADIYYWWGAGAF